MLFHCRTVNENGDNVEYILQSNPLDMAAYIHDGVVRLSAVYNAHMIRSDSWGWLEYGFPLYIGHNEKIELTEISYRNYKSFDLPADFDVKFLHLV